MSPALALIINEADGRAAGKLSLNGAEVVNGTGGRKSLVIRNDYGPASVRLCRPSRRGDREFDDVDLSTATVRVAIGSPDKIPTSGTLPLAVSVTPQTSGVLVSGKRYYIRTFQAGDSFTNIGAASNATGVIFTATGTTPTTWTNASEIQEITADVAVDATAEDLQTALNATATLTAAGGVSVTKPAEGVYEVAFVAFGAQPSLEGPITGNMSPGAVVSVSRIVPGTGTVHEIQLVRLLVNPYAYAEISTPFPVADYMVDTIQGATADLPATKRITLDPQPYAGQFVLTLDGGDPIEVPFNASTAQIAALLGRDYAVVRASEISWDISGVEPAQDIAIVADVSGLLVPMGVSGSLPLNTIGMHRAFAATTAKTLTLTHEVEIEWSGEGRQKVYQGEIEIGRDLIDLSTIVPSPIPVSDYAALSTLISGKQPLHATLTAIAALATTAWGRALLTKVDGPALLAYISGQPLNSGLTAIAALATAAYGRSLLTKSSSAAARSYLDAPGNIDIFIPRSSQIYVTKIATYDSDVEAGGGTNASANAAAINNALAAIAANSYGGRLIFEGAVLGNAPLLIGDNTTIFCPDDGCGYFLASGSNCHLLTNSNLTGTANPGEPAAEDRQKNITIIGGTWNGNYANQSRYLGNGPSTNRGNVGMWFNGVDDLCIERVTIYDARLFALMITYPDNPRILDFTGKWPVKRNDNNDVIHIWGPATGLISARDTRAINGSDDTIALNFCESADPLNGNVDFTGRVAAETTRIDGVRIDNGSAILRVDGSLASAGDITVGRVDCTFTSDPNPLLDYYSALMLYTEGTWRRLLLPDWTINVPANLGAERSKGMLMKRPRGGSITQFMDWRFTGDANPSTIYGQRNAVITIEPDADASSDTPARIIVDGMLADKPTAAPSGGMVYITPYGGTSTPRIDLEIRNSEIRNFQYLVAQELGVNVLNQFNTENNTLNEAAELFGARPRSIAKRDSLSAIGASATRSANQSILNNTAAPIAFNAESGIDVDFTNIHSTTVNNSQFVVPSNGWYTFGAHAAFYPNATGLRELRLVLNGFIIVDRDLRPAISGDVTFLSVSSTSYLTAGTYVEAWANQTSGITLDIIVEAEYSPQFYITRFR
jgi:hypothetical protein